MEIAACIGTALSNALRLEEIQTQHVRELRRLQALQAAALANPALSNPAFPRPLVDDVFNSKLRAENASLQQRVMDQDSGIEKLRHQARTLTKCASRALELLVRSRGSSATTDPEILQLRKQLRKYGVLDIANGDRGEEKHGPRTEFAVGLVRKTVEGPVIAQSDLGLSSSSQVPAHHAKRQRSEKNHEKSLVLGATGVAARKSVSEQPSSPQDLETSINFGAVVEDEVHATSFPVLVDDGKNDASCDELFHDVALNNPAQHLVAPTEALLKPLIVAPVIGPSDVAQSLAGPVLPPTIPHWMSAQPGDRHMKFAATFATTAAPTGRARVAWDAPNAADDEAFETGLGQDAAASVKRALLPHRQSTEPLPPTVEKPQNFIQVVRGGARDKLPGHGCKQCDAFYAALESAMPQGQMPSNLCDGSHHAVDTRLAVANIRDNASRHRAAFRKQDSPEDYWTTKFKD